MTPEQIKHYLKYTQNEGLYWDKFEEAEKLADDPGKFETFFRRYHGKRIYNLLFNKNDLKRAPILMVSSEPWVAATAKWVLEHGTLN